MSEAADLWPPEGTWREIELLDDEGDPLGWAQRGVAGYRVSRPWRGKVTDPVQYGLGTDWVNTEAEVRALFPTCAKVTVIA